jgi:hypothetical protein
MYHLPILRSGLNAMTISRQIIIGVMGPGEGATDQSKNWAFELGKLIAEQGWMLLTGGRDEGVMDSASKGAKSAHGLTIGIIPADDCIGVSAAVDIPIITGMGSARNNINVLTSTVVIACGMGAGTASEVALALKARKSVILLTNDDDAKQFFKKLDPARVHFADTPTEAINVMRSLLLNEDKHLRNISP